MFKIACFALATIFSIGASAMKAEVAAPTCSYVPEPTSMAPTSPDNNFVYFTTTVGQCVNVGVSIQIEASSGYYMATACWADPNTGEVCGNQSTGYDQTVVVKQAVCNFIAMNANCYIYTTPALCSYVPEPSSMAPTSPDNNFVYFTTTVGGCVNVGVSIQIEASSGYYMATACWADPNTGEVCGQQATGYDRTVVVTLAVCNFIAMNANCYIYTTPALCSYVPEPTSMAPTSPDNNFVYFTTTVGGCVNVGVSIQIEPSSGYYMATACWADPNTGEVCGNQSTGYDQTVVVKQAVCNFIAMNANCYIYTTPALCSYVPEPTSMAPTSPGNNFVYFTTTVGQCINVGVSVQSNPSSGYYVATACWVDPNTGEVCGQQATGYDQTVVVKQAVCNFIAMNANCYIYTTPALCSYVPEPTSMAPTNPNSNYMYFLTNVSGCVNVSVSVQTNPSSGYYVATACWVDPNTGEVCGNQAAGYDYQTVVETQAVCNFIATKPICYTAAALGDAVRKD